MRDIMDQRRRCRLIGLALLAAASVGSLGRAQEAGGAARPDLPKGAVALFDGADTSRWIQRRGGGLSPWKVVDGAIVAGGGDILTKDGYQDFQLHIEFMTPDMPNARGQGKGNSGVYLQGRYEIQILDSYGIESPGKGDCGAIYDQSAALVNACKPPLQWQSYDILFRAPRFDAEGKRTENARVTVLQNGVPIQNNTEIHGTTTAGMNTDPAQPGPILLQDHGNPVKYRNLWILPLPAAGSPRY
jgi:hypothetical protein